MIKIKIKHESGIVNIRNIPELRAHLEPSFCLEMLKELRSFGNYLKIAGLINEPISKNGLAYTITNFKIRKSGPTELVYKIGEFLFNKGLKKFSPNNIERHIIGISVYGMNKSIIKSPKIPLDFTTESGCIFISAMLHDGGITEAFKPHYWNTDIELRKKVYESAQDIFGVLPSRFNPNSEAVRFPKVCGLVLAYGLGLKIGNKIFTDPTIPKFIFNLPQEKISAFLRQAFDDEGTVSSSNNLVRIMLSIKYSNKPPRLLIQLRELLHILGINFTKPSLSKEYIAKKDGIRRSSWYIVLTGRDELEIFKAKVDFSMNRKSKELDKILNNVKEKHFKWGTIEKQVLNASYKLESKHGFFTRKSVAKEIGRTWSRMQQIFPKLLKEGKIVQITKYSGTTPARFKLR